MNNDDLNKIGQVVEEKINKALEPVHQKLDALTGDVINLQDQTKAIWDKISLGDDRNKREVDEIKEHLGLPPSDPA